MTYIETKADTKLLEILKNEKIANYNDEIWKLIIYPHFYVNILFPMNIVYISSLGRVMTLNGIIKEYSRPNQGFIHECSNTKRYQKNKWKPSFIASV